MSKAPIRSHPPTAGDRVNIPQPENRPTDPGNSAGLRQKARCDMGQTRPLAKGPLSV